MIIKQHYSKKKFPSFAWFLIIALFLGLTTNVVRAKEMSCKYNPDIPLRVATNGIWKPFTYMQTPTTLAGWDIDYIHRVMREISSADNYSVVQRDWGEGCCSTPEGPLGPSIPPTPDSSLYFWSIFSGNVDMGISATSDSARRLSHLKASKRYAFSPGHVLFTIKEEDKDRYDITNKGLSALNDTVIGVSAVGSNQDYYLNLLLTEEDSINFSIVYGDLEELLETSQVDLVFGAVNSENDNYLTTGNVKILDVERFTKTWGTGAAILFPQDSDPELLTAVNCAIDIISSDVDFFNYLKKKHGKGSFCSPELTDEECAIFQDL